MRLTKRGKQAVQALLDGQNVEFAGWPVDEALAVLDAALARLKTIRRHGLVKIEKLERAAEEGRKYLAELEASLEAARAELPVMDENIRILTEKRAELEAGHEGQGRD